MSVTWSDAIDEYCSALRGIGRRPQTIVLYRHYLRQTAALLGGSPWEVTTRQLEAMMGAVPGGASAHKSARTAVAGFYRWAQRTERMRVDPALGLPTVRVPRGRPRPTPEGIVAEALERADARERLMVELGALAGLRAGEISRVHRNDYDGDMLLVHGKGGHERLVPIVHGHLRDALLACDGWLFPNTQRGGNITPNHVSKILSRLLPAPWTAHTLRHRFGTVAYAATRDLLAVSKLLGHASTETTLIYVQMPDDHLRNAVAAAATIGAVSPSRKAA